MNRDFTMWGAGLITGHLAWSLATQTVSTASAVVAILGLLLIIGSRGGFFGKRT